jgi:hypothetical protein
MRHEDWQLAVESSRYWQGAAGATPPRCSLLANLDALLAFLEEAGITPGDAIAFCPACKHDHRWVLIKELLIYALDVQPRRNSKLLEWADQSLEEVRELYGGDEGYRKMRTAADAYFAKIGAKDVYRP